MQIAGVDLYVYHGVLGIGASEWMPATLALEPDEPAASCDTHVLVKVRAQHELVRVRLFKVQEPEEDPSDQTFENIYDHELRLDDGRIVIGDVVGGSRLNTAMIHDPGRHRTLISADTPGDATAIDVVVIVPGPLPYYMTTAEPPAPIRIRK